MQSQFFFRMALTLLIIKYANAETRRDFKFRFELDEQVNEAKIQEELIGYILEMGIELDEKSELYIHEESNHIDFSCFNCITGSIQSYEEIQHSHNWRVEK